MQQDIVSIWHDCDYYEYPQSAPYNPSESYPEYDGDISRDIDNRVYSAIRNSFLQLGFDKERSTTPYWNPLGFLIEPGNTVLLKPNFVFHENKGNGSFDAIITHPSVIRAVIDYVYIALNGNGRIIIADAPQADADFDEIIKKTKLKSIEEYYQSSKGFLIEIIDLRQIKFEYKDGVLLDNSRISLDGDPIGYTVFDLGFRSQYVGILNPERIYGADYDRSEVTQHHNSKNHEYCVANSILNADVIISLPKMKTHRKSGVTLCLKNFVGINGNKNYLPHFKIGVAADGGDEYEILRSNQKIVKYTKRFLIDKLLVNPNKLKSLAYHSILFIYRSWMKVSHKQYNHFLIDGGGWYGNDTIWRMILDLNFIMQNGTIGGQLSGSKRKLFFIVDGMIAGQGNGPLSSDDKCIGTIVMGENPLLVDLLCIRLMNIDYRKIKLYEKALELELFGGVQKAENVSIVSNDIKGLNWDDREVDFFSFIEPDGWRNYLSIDR